MEISELHIRTWEQLHLRRIQMPHALLVSGQRGMGVFELVRSFVQSLLCENLHANGSACEKCPACVWFSQGNHPDFRLLQPEALSEGGTESAEQTATKKKPSQQITIDQVRGLDDFLHIGTHRHGRRIVLINPADAMNRATANSLLKSLEEPLPSTLFILVSHDPQRLLPTIRSRCQSLYVRPPERHCAEAWLAHAGIKEAAQWLALAGGAPLLALELHAGEERALLDLLVERLSQGENLDPLSSATSVDKLLKSEKRPLPLSRAIDWAQKWIIDLVLAKQFIPPRYFVGHHTLMQGLIRTTDLSRLLVFYRKTLQYRLECDQPLNSRLFFETFFMNYVAVFRTF